MAYDHNSGHSLKLTDDEQQMLDIFLDCGFGEVLSTVDDIDPMKQYMINLPDALENATLRAVTGDVFYYPMRAALKGAARLSLSKGALLSFHWIFSRSDGVTLQRLIRFIWSNKLYAPPLSDSYDASHPKFAKNSEEYERWVTLMILESFPKYIGTWQPLVMPWMSHYEQLQHKYGDVPLLRKMRTAICRYESRNHYRHILCSSGEPGNVKGKTAASKKYLALPAYQRVELLRQYNCGQ